MDCIGKRTVKIDGRDTETWCFAWRHYGCREEVQDEKMYVTEDRQLVLIEWGPDYQNCRTEMLPKKRVLELTPKSIRD
ncbi:MAG TPA: hypothetical protein ENL03_03370 [Phycisphaerae bacterium]|nr:hypothetical protein [Phycisphaerae bacterium]